MTYRLTRAAAADLRTIYRQGIAAFGPAQASAYHAHLAATFTVLAAHPLIARERPEITPPVRIHPSGAHIVIYCIDPDGTVLILRVRHARENWSAL